MDGVYAFPPDRRLLRVFHRSRWSSVRDRLDLQPGEPGRHQWPCTASRPGPAFPPRLH